MRPKVFFGICLAAVCVLALVVMLSKTTRPQPPAAPAPAAPVAVMPAPPSTFVPSAPAAMPKSDTNAIALKREQHEEYVKQRYDDLMAIAALNDSVAHQEIVRELTNSDPEIRKAALEAIQQTSDRSLIPQMKQIAATTDDPEYQQALQDAIDFMELPTLTEYRQQQKALQNSGGNPSPQTPASQNPPSHSQGQPGQGQNGNSPPPAQQ